MKLTRQSQPDTTYRIRRYEPGRITVNETVYERSLVVSPDELFVDWPPESFSELEEEHMRFLATLSPELVLLGTGANQHFPNPGLLRALITQGIGVEVMDTAAACRTYNVLLAEERRVAAALFMI